MSFATQPFEEQLHRIDAAASSASDSELLALLSEAADLVDGEPFARLAAALLGRSEGVSWALLRAIDEAANRLSDTALRPLLALSPAPAAFEAWRLDWAVAVLCRWSLDRASALALLSRWVRRRSPERYAAIEERARQEIASPPTAESARWLFFVRGRTLSNLLDDPLWRDAVSDAVAGTIRALATAPKSLSQAHAEELLSRRVYADPGHFFFELLQNADDAEAASFSIRVSDDRVVVEHDGEPFSLRDLVGVLSVGQTTKRADQIGFFGVGFKSVYEITERPRIYSGALAFEIAHVSIPRAVAARERQPSRTRLVLPYRPPGLSPDAVAELHRSATDLPPETLLTLAHTCRFSVEASPDRRLTERGAGGRGGATTGWRIQRHDLNTVSLVGLDGSDRRYRLMQRQVRLHTPEDGRATESPVLVALAMGERGPQPLSGPTLYAFLPTAQHTGLRFMIHARFDVTLDRERLESDSPTNRQLLHEAGKVLAEHVKALAETLPYAVLPTRADLAPVAQPVLAGLIEALRQEPLFRGADGVLVSPIRARVVPEPLVPVLAGLDLGDGDRAIASLEPRARTVAMDLGARPFGAVDLMVFLEATLDPGAAAPEWFLAADAWATIVHTLATLPVDDGLETRLQSLPFLRARDDTLITPSGARVAIATIARLYEGLRPLVDADTIDQLPGSLRERLHLRGFSYDDLAADLEAATAPAAVDPPATVFPELLDRKDALYDALAEAPDALLRRLEPVPLIERSTGVRWPVDSSEEGRLYREDVALAGIADVVGSTVPMVSHAAASRHPRLMHRWLPPFGLDELARVVPLLPERATEALAPYLDALAVTMPARLVDRFARAPLFRDRSGWRRPLLGKGRAMVTRDPALPVLWPTAPWLAEPDRPFVAVVRVPDVDAPTIADALTVGHDAPGVTPELLEWLAKRASELSRGSTDRLLRARVWPDEVGVLGTLPELHAPTSDTSTEALRFYSETGIRRPAHAATVALVSALGASAELPSPTARTIVRDLLRLDEAPSVDRLFLASVINSAAADLSSKEVHAVWALPLFAAEDGSRRALTATRFGADPCTVGPESACLRPGPFRTSFRRGPWLLLSEEDETLFSPFLAVAGPDPATVNDLVQAAAEREEVLDDSADFLAAVRAHAADLDDDARETLQTLPFLTSRAGSRGAPATLAIGTVADECLGSELVRVLALDDALLPAALVDTVVGLGLDTRPLRDVLAQRVLGRLAEGMTLPDALNALGGRRPEHPAARAAGDADQRHDAGDLRPRHAHHRPLHAGHRHLPDHRPHPAAPPRPPRLRRRQGGMSHRRWRA